MKELEENLLYKLVNTKGSLVDDESLIVVLQNTKTTSEEVKAQLAVSEQTSNACSGLCDEVGYKTTLPRLQEMQAAHPEWIQRRVLKRHLAYGRHAYRGEILAVSHRWEQPEAPDASGAQLRAIREYLQSPAGLEVSFVLYDYW